MRRRDWCFNRVLRHAAHRDSNQRHASGQPKPDQTWARRRCLETSTDATTGVVTRTTQQVGPISWSRRWRDWGGGGGVAPVGEAFLRAVQTGLATRDMWSPDAQADGLIDLWFDDGLHASKYGSYLSALVLFGELTGLDPAQFGDDEIAALDLGIDARSALLLQRVASDQLGFARRGGSLTLVALALALLAVPALRRRGVVR